MTNNKTYIQSKIKQTEQRLEVLKQRLEGLKLELEISKHEQAIYYLRRKIKK